MSDWRPFEPSREAIDAAKQEADRNTCNRHDDCAAADRAVLEAGGRDVRAGAWGWHRVFTASHCHDECCEECFGS